MPPLLRRRSSLEPRLHTPPAPIFREARSRAAAIRRRRPLALGRPAQKVPLSRTEVIRVLLAAPSIREKLILALAYFGELAPDEIAVLRFAELDVAGGAALLLPRAGSPPVVLERPEIIDLLGALPLRPGAYLFPAGGASIGPRTCAHAFERAMFLAGVPQGAFAPETSGSRRSGAAVSALRRCHAEHAARCGGRRAVSRADLSRVTLYAFVGGAASRARGAPPIPGLELSLAPAEVDGRRPAMLAWRSGGASVEVGGVLVERKEADWVRVSAPPLERWRASLEGLPRHHRAALTDVSVFEYMRVELAARMMES